MSDIQGTGAGCAPEHAEAVKASVLLSHDLSMLATAAKYDLDRREDRVASNVALVELFFRIASLAGVDLFVEAGAKEASASQRATAELAAARVVAFEANPYNYVRYAPSNVSAGIEYLGYALTDMPGPVTFNVLRDDAGNPLANGRSSLLRRQREGDQQRGFEEVTVEGVTLDGFFADTSFDRAAIWVDVEGACRMVLNGARQLLARTSVVFIEVEEMNWWGEGHWLRESVVSFLYDLGLVPVARDFEYLHQYNIVFVRDTLLRAPTPIRWELTRFASRAIDGGRIRPGPGPRQSR
ncbi:FkbM family methyltransferase [Krasilnikovia sp. MM14-A1259]|uniref:FkbM family methyltransferase n=1 Tax=Krasilnikovia sp. MM14-A1259 TaxID=3373539 RepID=UPI0037F7E54E